MRVLWTVYSCLSTVENGGYFINDMKRHTQIEWGVD